MYFIISHLDIIPTVTIIIIHSLNPQPSHELGPHPDPHQIRPLTKIITKKHPAKRSAIEKSHLRIIPLHERTHRQIPTDVRQNSQIAQGQGQGQTRPPTHQIIIDYLQGAQGDSEGDEY